MPQGNLFICPKGESLPFLYFLIYMPFCIRKQNTLSNTFKPKQTNKQTARCNFGRGLQGFKVGGPIALKCNRIPRSRQSGRLRKLLQLQFLAAHWRVSSGFEIGTDFFGIFGFFGFRFRTLGQGVMGVLGRSIPAAIPGVGPNDLFANFRHFEKLFRA